MSCVRCFRNDAARLRIPQTQLSSRRTSNLDAWLVTVQMQHALRDHATAASEVSIREFYHGLRKASVLPVVSEGSVS